MIEVVVARYNENVNWLNTLDCKKTIYNKGEYSIPDSIVLPNVGRESHTYFHHIVENYDNLADWTFFIQANPFDHVRTMDFIIANFPLTTYYGKINVNNQVYFFTNGDFKKPLLSNSDGTPTHLPYLNLNELYRMILPGKEIPSEYEFTAGCMFCASKEAILKNSKDFYIKCLQISKTRKNAPWEFERIMQYIFK
jgi:hypothetical protein